jgi:transcriptional regulator with XRE-family HTH domain
VDPFKTFVQDWLDRRGWSKARLAEAAGLNQSLMSRYLSGDSRKRISRPSDASLRKLAPVLGESYESLLRMCGYLPPEAEIQLEGVAHGRATTKAAIEREFVAEANALVSEYLSNLREERVSEDVWKQLLRGLFAQGKLQLQTLSEIQCNHIEAAIKPAHPPARQTRRRPPSKSGRRESVAA